MPKHRRIKDLSVCDRPLEKLLSSGSTHLSDTEIIALLLGSGNTTHSAIELAQRLIQKNPKERFANITHEKLISIPGIGDTKAARILAAIELGQRLFFSSSLQLIYIHTIDDILPHIRDISSKTQEHLVALYLNARYELIQKETISIGNLNTVHIEPRSIFAPVIATPCASVILAHNHPSGDTLPSEADVYFTARIYHAGRILGISLTDHIIIARSGYISMKEIGVFPEDE